MSQSLKPNEELPFKLFQNGKLIFQAQFKQAGIDAYERAKNMYKKDLVILKEFDTIIAKSK